MPSIATSLPLAPKVSLPRRGLKMLGYAVAPTILSLLASVYTASPDFFLQYIHEDTRRELMAVELTTVVCAGLGGVLLLAAALRRAKAGQKSAASLVAVVGCAALFFAGEEMSWGQSYFGWKTPSSFAAFSRETNLHNSSLGVQSFGNLFLIVVFFVLPGWAWLKRRKGPTVLAAWRSAIASGPVVCCVAAGFLWKEIKNLYRFWYADHREHLVYQEFIMHMNEHKELLVAVALFMFGVMQVRDAFANKRA